MSQVAGDVAYLCIDVLRCLDHGGYALPRIWILLELGQDSLSGLLLRVSAKRGRRTDLFA